MLGIHTVAEICHSQAQMTRVHSVVHNVPFNGAYYNQ